jgi:ribosomal protein S27AE
MDESWNDYRETRTKSRKRCPECGQRMMEVTMPDFGPRWQCEDCRLTVFVTGGVQPWRGPAKEPAVH